MPLVHMMVCKYVACHWPHGFVMNYISCGTCKCFSQAAVISKEKFTLKKLINISQMPCIDFKYSVYTTQVKSAFRTL